MKPILPSSTLARRFSRLLVKASLVVALLVGGLIAWRALGYFTPDFSKGYLLDKEGAWGGIFTWALYAHVIAMPIMLLIGAGQLWYLRVRFPRIHRLSGKVYVGLVLLLGAPSGLVLSFYAFGGWLSTLSFALLSILFAGFTLRAFLRAKRKRFSEHAQDMLRSYILATSAVWLRILSFLFIHYFDWSGAAMYITISWLSWLPFWLGYEGWLGIKGR